MLAHQYMESCHRICVSACALCYPIVLVCVRVLLNSGLLRAATCIGIGICATLLAGSAALLSGLSAWVHLFKHY